MGSESSATSVPDLQGVLDVAVAAGAAPGLVGLIDRPDGRTTATAGVMEPGRPEPVRLDTIFRLASACKPITAALLMTLIDDGTVSLTDPVDRWLPELADRRVLRKPDADLDDTEPAERPILVEDLLTSRPGYGFPPDFSLPWVQRLLAVSGGGPAPRLDIDADRWLADLARLPLLHQPGAGWLYNTCSDLQGVLISRAADRALGEVLADRLLQPLGMSDTGFHVPAEDLDRCVSSVRIGDDGYTVTESGAGEWSRPALFESGSGGMVSTASDWAAFGAMVLAGGVAADGRRVLSEQSVTAMRTDHTTADDRRAGEIFLDGQGWGYGGGVDIAPTEPWNVLGRYGWIGGSGTAGYVIPATGTTVVLLGQVAMTGPGTPDYMGAVLELAVGSSPAAS